MANITLQIRIGKEEADQMGREYRFSVGDVHTKINNKEFLDFIEKITENAIEKKYGPTYEQR